MDFNYWFNNFINFFLTMDINKFILNNQLSKVSEINALINPNAIDINLSDINDDFWSQHNESRKRYKELVINYNKALCEIEKKGSLNHLNLDHPINMAHQIFHGSEPIKVIEYKGKYFFNGSGRHRIIAAQILLKEGHDIKIYVKKTKFINNIISNNNNISTNIKLNNMSYEIERQIELLNDAKNVFNQHAQQLTNLIEMFNSAIRSFEHDDLNHDYQEFLNEFNGEYNNKLKYLIRDIEDEYIPAIIKKVEYLEDRV